MRTSSTLRAAVTAGVLALVLGGAALPVADSPAAALAPAAARQAPSAAPDRTAPVERTVTAGSGMEGQRVPFRPYPGTFPTGVGRAWALRGHTLVIVPTYATTPPDRALVTRIGRDAAAFWERQVPGMRITVKVTAPVRQSARDLCDARRGLALTSRKASLPQPSDWVHVATVATACPGHGLANVGSGNRIFAAGTDPHILAHEFGHNLTLQHANTLTCTAGGRAVALSRRCIEREYADMRDVMGAGGDYTPVDALDGYQPTGAPLPTVAADGTLSGVAQAVLSGRVAKITSRGGTVTVRASGTADRTAQVSTRYGTVFLTASPALPYADVPAGVTAHLATREGSGRLTLPGFDGQVRADDPLMEIGDSWTIDGSPLTVTVMAVTVDGARLAFTPTRRRGPAPAAPTLTGPSALDDGPADLTWTTVPGAVYVVTVNDAVTARTTGTSAEVIQPSPGDRVIVWAIGPSGKRTPSAPLILPERPFIDPFAEPLPD